MKNAQAIVIVLILISNFLYPQNSKIAERLKTNFDFSGKRSNVVQYYNMQSVLISYSLQGNIQEKDVFRVKLKYTPGNTEEIAPVVTCVKFTIQLGDSAEVEIPILKNWAYKFLKNETGAQKGTAMFGVTHSIFENLKDANNKLIPHEKAYHVYNAFIDFHSFCDVFSECTDTGESIKNLHFIGDKISHAAANLEAPVNLGSKIDEGSTFKNGNITLELTGLSIINDKPCALLTYDSGESTFKMFMTPMPGMKIENHGTSHYFGNIHRSLIDNWMKKATLHEFVTSETLLPIEPKKLPGIAERIIVVDNVEN